MLINALGNSEDNPCGPSGVCLFRDMKSWAQMLQNRRRRAFAFLRTLGDDASKWTDSAKALASWANAPDVRAEASYHDDAVAFVMDYRGHIDTMIPMIHEGDVLLAAANAPNANGTPGEYGSTTDPIKQAKSLGLLLLAGYAFLKVRG